MTVESQMILIFGGTGDLTRRKLIPAFYHLLRKRQLTDCTPIICIGRRELNREQFLDQLAAGDFIQAPDEETLQQLKERIEYFRYDAAVQSAGDFAAGIGKIRERYGCTSNLLIYLALPTTAFQKTAELISALDTDGGWRRVVFEKPFGEDLRSARELNSSIRSVLQEDEIYRVDHYLGKELVQNILTLRFANEVFSGAWRRRAIDHVQITVAETLGVEKRAGYYDRSGAVRDMIQNHLLQLLSFVAMEPPAGDRGDGLRDAAVEVLRCLRPLDPDDIVLGQYVSGSINGDTVNGYCDEEGVAAGSKTETFAALRAYVDTDRWRDVPFYLRTGKRLRHRYADIKIVFRRRRRHIVGSNGEPNMIVIRIQPDEGIALAFNVQKPGEESAIESVMMDFCHHCHFGPNTPEAYESILRNVIEGDHSLFPRRDWIEASWEWVDRLRAVALPPVEYVAGSDGPPEADRLLAVDGRSWLNEEVDRRKITIPDIR